MAVQKHRSGNHRSRNCQILFDDPQPLGRPWSVRISIKQNDFSHRQGVVLSWRLSGSPVKIQISATGQF